MRRRSVLCGFCGSLALAGCLTRRGDRGAAPDGSSATDSTRRGGTPSPTESTDRRYETCSRGVIPYEQLPPEIRAEVDAAREGHYEARRVHLGDAMNVTRSYVAVSDTYYDPAVTTEGEKEVLTLHRVEPKALPDPRPVSVEHHLDGERVVTVEVVADDGTVLFDTTMDLWPGGAVEFGHVARVGTHAFRVTVARDGTVGMEATKSIRVGESLASVAFRIDSDGIRASQATADPPACRYDA
jgi:hypothetical protein